jgi:hypothetical protein
MRLKAAAAFALRDRVKSSADAWNALIAGTASPREVLCKIG